VIAVQSVDGATNLMNRVFTTLYSILLLHASFSCDIDFSHLWSSTLTQ